MLNNKIDCKFNIACLTKLQISAKKKRVIDLEIALMERAVNFT